MTELHRFGYAGRCRLSIFRGARVKKDARFGGPRDEKAHGPAAVDSVRAEKSEGIGMMAGHKSIDLRIEVRIARAERFRL